MIELTKEEFLTTIKKKRFIVLMPLLFIGAHYVLKATEHYKRTGGESFTGSVVGIEREYWDGKDKD